MHPTGQPDTSAIGEVIRELRCALHWSQGRLAAELRAVSGRDTLSREDISRWEHGRRVPGPWWALHIAAALQVPLSELEAAVRRRQMIISAAALAGAAIAGIGDGDGRDLWASVAAGDSGPLSRSQTSHATDLALARLAAADRPVALRLARWAQDGASGVLRVNASGILAKLPDTDAAGTAVAVLRRDPETRLRYARAVTARAGTTTGRLRAELANAHDAGARWCSAWLLARDGSPAARSALACALRTEPVTENVRTIGMLLNGDDPCC